MRNFTFPRSFAGFAWFLRLSGGVPKLSENSFRTLKEFFRLWTPVITMLALAAGLGVQAYGLSASESLSGWLDNHPPGKELIKNVFEIKGFELVTNKWQIETAYKTLPSVIDAPGSIWLGEGEATTVIAWVQTEAAATDPVTFFCFECKNRRLDKLSWTPLGKSWTALDAFSERSGQLNKSRPLKRKNQTGNTFVDRREWRF